METLFGSLILAAITALSIIAYRNLAAYKKLLPWLLFVLSFIFFGLLVWNIALTVARSRVIEEYATGMMGSKFNNSFDPIILPWAWIIFCVGLIIYFKVLLIVQNVIHQGSDGEPKEK